METLHLPAQWLNTVDEGNLLLLDGPQLKKEKKRKRD